MGRGPRPNVIDQQRDHASLLRWFAEMIGTLRECPEVGSGTLTVLDLPLPPAVLAHRFDATEGTLLVLHNLDAQPVTVDIGQQQDIVMGSPREAFGDDTYPAPTRRAHGLAPEPVRLPLDPTASRMDHLSSVSRFRVRAPRVSDRRH